MRWDCDSKAMEDIKSSWGVVTYFFLGVAVPFVYSIMVTHGYPKAVRWSSINITLIYLIGVVYLFLLGNNPNLILVFNNLRTDVERILFRVKFEVNLRLTFLYSCILDFFVIVNLCLFFVSRCCYPPQKLILVPLMNSFGTYFTVRIARNTDIINKSSLLSGVL